MQDCKYCDGTTQNHIIISKAKLPQICRNSTKVVLKNQGLYIHDAVFVSK